MRKREFIRTLGSASLGLLFSPSVLARYMAMPYNPQPICAVIAGNLYNDDLILSVANKYQMATDWHTRHPKL